MTEKKPLKKENGKAKKLHSVSVRTWRLVVIGITIFVIAGFTYLCWRLDRIEDHLKSRLDHSKSLTESRIAYNVIFTQGRLENIEEKVNYWLRKYAQFATETKLLLETDESGNSAK